MSGANHLPGFRLHRLELFNWGTFDQTVHSLCPEGESVLLVGENGAGKSTLIDAVLTLLVRPGVRNYNVAAGAGKKERDETSYIRGAYDKYADQDERSRTRYLRDRRDFHTALLAEFQCTVSARVVTVCQVMHAGADRRVVWYGITDDKRSIAKDLSSFDSVKSIKREMEVAGWDVTDSFTKYHARLQRKFKFQPKAMDVFNQTVAVKDVAKLNDFIRTHMLEKKSYNSKVDKLLRHFAELSETYRKLVEVRLQAKTLVPVDHTGADYESIEAKLQVLTSQRRWLDWYFDDATNTMLEPLCTKWRDKADVLSGEVESLDNQIHSHSLEIGAVQAQIDQRGDGRIPRLQQKRKEQLAESNRKRSLQEEIQRIASECSLRCDFTSLQRFDAARQQVREHCDDLQVKSDQVDQQRLSLLMQIQTNRTDREIEEAELESLMRRKNNLPSYLIDVRHGLCETLRLTVRDLPFAAELIQVQPGHLPWQASIELVLNGFARTLLVEEAIYNDVSHLINGRRLRDGRGGGVRIAYDRVGPLSSRVTSLDDGLATLCDMVEYQPGHPLSPYVRGQIEQRFRYQACESIGEFQTADGPAMTANRHIKSDRRRHVKDDRNAPDDRRHFVLGWDNKNKIRLLKQSIAERRGQEAEWNAQATTLKKQIDLANRQVGRLQRILELEDFDQIDFARHDAEADRCLQEIRKLEQADDQLRVLKEQLGRLNAELEGYRGDRSGRADQLASVKQQLKSGEELLGKVKANLAEYDETIDEELLSQLQSGLPIVEGEFELLEVQRANAVKKWDRDIRSFEEKLQPVAERLRDHMNKFLRKFPAFTSELSGEVSSLEGFRRLKQRIDEDELPGQTNRFRDRLKSSVLQELGLLRNQLEDERHQIRERIETLNDALRPLGWEDGSYIRLEPKDSNDAEVRAFGRELYQCLEGNLDSTDEANEQMFRRVEAFVEKLRDDGNTRWREKVVDVRNWFHFVARVCDEQSGDAIAEYDGGSGKSGGEKGKLAFLVLVAAIAYQYDLKPDDRNDARFHFVMVDEMFSRSDDTRARAALELFERFGLQLAIVAPLDAKARVVEDHVGMYCHVVKDAKTHRSRLLSVTAEQYEEVLAASEAESES